MKRTLFIADAVVSEIESEVWMAGQVSADRVYAPRIKAEDVSSARAYVVPASTESQVVTRDAGHDHTHNIGVGLFRSVRGDESTRDSLVDDLIQTMGELTLHFLRRRLTLPDTAIVVCTAAETDPLYDAELLEQEGLFASVLTLGFWDSNA